MSSTYATLTFLLLAGVLEGASPGLTRWVDPRIGAEGGAGGYNESNNTIGPLLPWGSVLPQPDTPQASFSGYNPTQPIRGFSQLHVTGGGGAAGYGNFLISPQIGLAVEEEAHDSAKAEERAGCCTYRVKLVRYGITSEMTPTHHAAIYRFTFPKSNDAHVLFDLGHFLARDGGTRAPEGIGLQEGEVTVAASRRHVSGWGTYRGGYHGPFTVYFSADLSQAAETAGTWLNGRVSDASAQRRSKPGDRMGAYLKFSTEPGKPVIVKISVSFRSAENARRFLDQEIPKFDFANTAAQCERIWNLHLSTFLLDDATATSDERTIFYTAVWRSMHQPHNRTGDAPQLAADQPYWDDQFCTWDTWRTLFPLMTLVKESFTRANLQCYAARRAVGHFVGDDFLSGHDTSGGQGGDDVDNVIADAYAKQVSGAPWDSLYKLMKQHADEGRRLDNDVSYRERGWAPYPLWSSCSKTLEFAYNDFLIASVAKGLGLKEDHERFITRAQKWETLWDPRSESFDFRGFIRVKNADGRWAPFDPANGKYPDGRTWRGYYEGTSWIYSFFVPHDIARLVTLMGGADQFIRRLEFGLTPAEGRGQLFGLKPGEGRGRLLDASNEPGFLLAWLFHYAGRPDLSSAYIRDYEMPTWTMRNYGGQEDSGALASRHVWTVMGLYPNAGQDVYFIHGPRYRKLTVHLENGRDLVITGKGASRENKYVQSVRLNGKPYNRNWLRHDQLRNGGTLEFEMGAAPSSWARNSEPPPSLSRPVR